jgi:hypothetical protein
MLPFIVSSSESPRRVSPGQLQALLSVYQQDLLTGLVYLTPAANKREALVLFYVQGQLLCLYQRQPDGYKRHEAQARNVVLPKNEMDLQSFQVETHFIRPLQGIFENAKTEAGKTIATPSVPDTIRELEKSPEPLLAHFRWPGADGFSLIPGNGLTSRQFMFWSQDQASSIPNFARWPEPECTLTTYRGNVESRAWRENYLVLGFDFLYENIFNRYDELAGSNMVTRLEEQLNSISRTQGWQIGFFGHRLQDTHFFNSLSDMRIAYRTLLMAGQRHISGVVGEKLFEQSIALAAGSLPSVLRATLQSENILSTPNHL